MTTVIVPLAGPDLFSNKFGIRPLILVKDEFLIDAVIKKRFWYKNFNSNTDKLVFILRNIEIGLDNLKNHLTNNYPNCKIIVLSHLTKGAAFSVIPGLAYAEAFEHVIVDLADIITINEFNYKEKFEENILTGCLVPSFKSTEKEFSYIASNNPPNVDNIAEKNVISDNATIGIYIFRKMELLLCCFNEDGIQQSTKNGIVFVAPLINELIKKGIGVQMYPFNLVDPIGKIFHEN